VDILIIILLLAYILKGFKNGAVKEVVTFIGGFLVIVIAFKVKNPLSVYLYKNLPFFKFSGILSGISVLNIIVYELLSFVIVASVLMIIYKVVLAASNIFEVLLKATFILEIPSKIIGAIVGFIEGVCVIFIILFVCMQVKDTREYLIESKFSDMILTKTPILASASEPIYKSGEEIYALAEEYKDAEDKEEVNLQALDILLKYKVLDIENADTLVETGKLNISNVEDVLSKYRTES
jgi:uncharacterized membrane protein required for colicin V production